jgi:hypothetical protein
LHELTQADIEETNGSNEDLSPVDEVGLATEPETLPLWLQILEEEAGQMVIEN